MAIGVHSEVGRLRKVLVHRPGLEHKRLTPSNAAELLNLRLNLRLGLTGIAAAESGQRLAGCVCPLGWPPGRDEPRAQPVQ
jgi:hypothetical protein